VTAHVEIRSGLHDAWRIESTHHVTVGVHSPRDLATGWSRVLARAYGVESVRVVVDGVPVWTHDPGAK
jgi:hypothetical protein